MDCSTFSDSELVAKAIENRECFKCIVGKFEKRLRVFLARLSGLADPQIDDLLQETYVKAYRHLDTFDKNLKLSNWLYMIARNSFYDFYRSNKHYQRQISMNTSKREEQTLLEFLSVDERILEIVIQKECLEKVKSIICSLPFELKEVAILRWFDQKSYEEIGKIVDKPKGSIASHLHRARKEILRVLEEDRI